MLESHSSHFGTPPTPGNLPRLPEQERSSDCPPRTSKRRWIERRTFRHVRQNGRGRHLTDRLAIVELIGATTTKAGLKIECSLDSSAYEKGIRITDAETTALAIAGEAFPPESSYTIKHRSPGSSQQLIFAES